MAFALGTIVLIIIVIAGSLSAGYFFYLGYLQNRQKFPQKNQNQNNNQNQNQTGLSTTTTESAATPLVTISTTPISVQVPNSALQSAIDSLDSALASAVNQTSNLANTLLNQ